MCNSCQNWEKCIVNLQGIIQKFWEDVIKELEKMLSVLGKARQSLANAQSALSTKLPSMGCCEPPARIQEQNTRGSSYRKVFKAYKLPIID